jgi:hypothetical protein
MTLDLIDNFSDMDGFIFFDFPRMTNRYVKKVFQTDLPKFIKSMLLCLPLIYNWLNGSNKLSPIPASLFNNK